MSVPISLSDVVDALSFQTDTSYAFVNRETGEILTLTDEEVGAAEDGDDQLCPEWMQAEVPKIRAALAGDPWVPLPSSFDIHEWDMMRRFADQRTSEQERHHLQAAIHATGAFGRFREVLYQFHIEERWYRFRDREFERIAREWLSENGFTTIP